MADKRKLEKTSTAGIYRRHAESCKRNGRCRCSYVVRWKAQGKGHNRLFSTFELAREFKGEIASGKTSRKPPSRETVAGYYETWIDSYRGRTSRGLEDSTRREYEISFRLHIVPLPISRLLMRDVAAPDVRDWLKDLERRGASPSTIRRAKAAMSVMLACAVEDGDLPSNPAAGVRYVPTDAAKLRHSKAKAKVLGAKEVKAILDAMPAEWQAFFTLLAHSGVRIGELLGLTWGNVHLADDAHIVIAEQIYRGRRKRLKSDHGRRRIPLSPALATWLGELRPEYVAASAPVFPSKTGEPLNYANVYNRVLRPALVEAGIAVKVGEVKVRRAGGEEMRPVWDYQGVAFHRFRHACGSLLLARGDKDLRQVQGWLGHANPSFTHDRYIDLVDEGLGSADVLDEILPPRVHLGSTGHPEAAANRTPAETAKTAD